MRPTQGKYIVGLDHMRALAAGLVLSWHTLHGPFKIPVSTVPDHWISTLFEEGWCGVTLFIVITGFIFTTLTYKKEILFYPFLQNRFLRLFPLIFLMTLYGVYTEHTAKDSLFLFFGLLGGGTAYGTWTLVVELQFYVAYPFLRRTLVDGGLVTVIARCIGLCLVFATFRFIFFVTGHHTEDIAYWTIFGLADLFIAGIVGGTIFSILRDSSSRRLEMLAAVVLVLSCSALICFYYRLNVLGGFYSRDYPLVDEIWIFSPTLTSGLWACVVGSYCLLTRNAAGRLSRAVAYIGAISYSTYMLHFILIGPIVTIWTNHIGLQFSPDHFRNSAIVLAIFVYPMVLLISAASYEFVEKPFLCNRIGYLIPGPASPAD